MFFPTNDRTTCNIPILRETIACRVDALHVIGLHPPVEKNLRTDYNSVL